MKIGFLGTGNLARCIITGMVEYGKWDTSSIYCTGRDQAKLKSFTGPLGLHTCPTNPELVRTCDIVVLGVKPWMAEGVLNEIREALLEAKPLLVSIMAGIPHDDLQGLIGAGCVYPVVRAMPNINHSVGAGLTAICPGEGVTEAQAEAVSAMFSCSGLALPLGEKEIACFGAVGGASPAFAFMFIDALSRGGVKNGLPKPLATRVAAQAVLGSAKMVLESGEVPWALVDKVCSPGGLTVKGVEILEERGFTGDVMRAIDAVV